MRVQDSTFEKCKIDSAVNRKENNSMEKLYQAKLLCKTASKCILWF